LFKNLRRISPFILENTIDIPEAYAGHDALISYLRRRKNKSFWGFLLHCQEQLVNLSECPLHILCSTIPFFLNFLISYCHKQ